MSKAADAIEAARRVYVQAIGTAYEHFARRNLERVVAEARGESE